MLGTDTSGSFLDAIGGYLGAGGFVMPALLLCTVVLWYAIGSRWAALNRGSGKNVRVLLRRYVKGRGKPPQGIVDRAIALNPALEAFLGQDHHDVTRLADSFDRLETILNQGMVQ